MPKVTTDDFMRYVLSLDEGFDTQAISDYFGTIGPRQVPGEEAHHEVRTCVTAHTRKKKRRRLSGDDTRPRRDEDFFYCDEVLGE